MSSSIPSSSANSPAAVITVDPSSSAEIDALYINMSDTILHNAAANGKTLLAVEIATLEPSFAWKLNGQGHSPIHLALINGHFDTVRSLLAIDPELVRVKGKYRMTPLHYAAEMNATEILAEFLLYCPSAIADLNSRCESALHIAVKNRRLEACIVILGWLLNKQEESSDLNRVLNWKDADGNNVLHIAVSTNQLEVLKLLVPYINVCTRNLQGKSSLDLATHDEEAMKILLRGRLLHQIKDVKELSHAEHLISQIFSVKALPIYFLKALPVETRNIYLLVTGLVITATYQAMLSPPGGYNRLDTTTAAAPAPAPSPMRHNSTVEFVKFTSIFLAWNSIAFFLSSSFMIALVMPLKGSLILIIPAVILMMSYLLEVSLYSPKTVRAVSFLLVLIQIFVVISFFLFILSLFPVYYVRAWLSRVRALGPISPRGYIRK